MLLFYLQPPDSNLPITFFHWLPIHTKIIQLQQRTTKVSITSVNHHAVLIDEPKNIPAAYAEIFSIRIVLYYGGDTVLPHGPNGYGRNQVSDDGVSRGH